MEVVSRLEDKKRELEERLNNQWHGGSQRRDTLEYKIKKIDELITAYQTISEPVVLTEAEKILSQQVGFEAQKKKILTRLKTERIREQERLRKTPLILGLIGPSGTGKTTFAQIIALALKKKLFSINLGGLSDTSFLLGNSESSSGNEVGQLTKALSETKTANPLVLLDEIDKIGTSFKTHLRNHLVNVLDPTQNQAVLDYYLDVKLDFSQVTFIVTANSREEIPDYLRSRMGHNFIELSGYTIAEKKEIARGFIQRFFAQNESLSHKFEITSEALEALINKTQERGVRQLERALEEDIFDYCLAQWTQEASHGKTLSKIKIDSDLLNQIIPHNFSPVESEEQPVSKNDKEEIRNLRRELKELCREKERVSQQDKLKAVKLNAWLILRKKRKNFDGQEYNYYEEKINRASSEKEVGIIEQEILNKSRSLYPRSDKASQTLQDKLKNIEQQNDNLVRQLGDLKQKTDSEIEKLRKMLEKNLPSPEKSFWTIKNNPWFILFIASLIVGGFYYTFQLNKIEPKKQKKKKKTVIISLPVKKKSAR